MKDNEVSATTERGNTMWVVKIALDRPYTFMVLAVVIVILSPVVGLRTPTGIFPSVDIPVVALAWTYTGLDPEKIQGRRPSLMKKCSHRLWTPLNTSSPRITTVNRWSRSFSNLARAFLHVVQTGSWPSSVASTFTISEQHLSHTAASCFLNCRSLERCTHLYQRWLGHTAPLSVKFPFKTSIGSTGYRTKTCLALSGSCSICSPFGFFFATCRGRCTSSANSA